MFGSHYSPTALTIKWKLSFTKQSEKDGKLSTKLHDKRDDFDFHIVNFPLLSSNIPSGSSYGVCIS